MRTFNRKTKKERTRVALPFLKSYRLTTRRLPFKSGECNTRKEHRRNFSSATEVCHQMANVLSPADAARILHLTVESSVYTGHMIVATITEAIDQQKQIKLQKATENNWMLVWLTDIGNRSNGSEHIASDSNTHHQSRIVIT